MPTTRANCIRRRTSASPFTEVVAASPDPALNNGRRSAPQLHRKRAERQMRFVRSVQRGNFPAGVHSSPRTLRARNRREWDPVHRQIRLGALGEQPKIAGPWPPPLKTGFPASSERASRVASTEPVARKSSGKSFLARRATAKTACSGIGCDDMHRITRRPQQVRRFSRHRKGAVPYRV